MQLVTWRATTLPDRRRLGKQMCLAREKYMLHTRGVNQFSRPGSRSAEGTYAALR
jgi:hypothetical protein